jgi:F-type H+-transporting ATPase subunit epsilon
MALENLRCVIVTPERSVYDDMADFVAIPMYDGELGVLPGRAPLIGRLGFGELRVQKGANTHRFFLDGGFVQILDNTISLLTQRAIPEQELKVADALATLDAALERGPTPEEQETQLKRQARARAQLRMARRREQV